MDRKAMGDHIRKLREVISNFPVTAQEVIEDTEKNMVAVHATSQAHFHEWLIDDGIPAEDWNYKGTYVFTFTMNEAGDKIRKVVEFVDSMGTERLSGLMKRARANGEKRKAEKM